VRKILALLSFLILLAGLSAGIAAFWAIGIYGGPGPAPQDSVFTVTRGQGVSTVAANLQDEGLVRQKLIFQVAARLRGSDTKIHAGEYEISAHSSIQDILSKMESGAVVQHKFTVREGLTSWQVVQLLNDVEGLEGAVSDIPPEGSLLPETYSFLKGDTRAAKIAEMRVAMDKALEDLWPDRAANLPFETKEQALTLASIVEKETGVASERARIAGVFINRLRAGMPLQTDPTVIYALTKGKIEDKGQGPLGRRLLRDDLQVDSPYNTYRNAGLPPGPIANPGRAAIAAVLQPEENQFLYFVADGTGGHVFSKTLAEHDANVAKWRKIRRAQGN
jgi:UPF0755 protein